ncbi:MAG: hypothetical protein V3V08_11720 [Nannocystaceae bacterium]
MRTLKDLARRAKRELKSRLPPQFVDAGRRVGEEVLRRAPPAVRDVLKQYAAVPVASVPEVEGEAISGADTSCPDDATVVIYTTSDERGVATTIRSRLRGYDVFVREVNLASHPHMARQLAQQTQVFVPPYVYIRGRFWGAMDEIESLHLMGELGHVLAGDLDRLSADARRIGKLRDTFSDDMTVENILARLRQGHILCVDDLDCWYEQDNKEPRFYYQGGPRPVDGMEAVAAHIAKAVAAGEAEASWRFEPEVQI